MASTGDNPFDFDSFVDTSDYQSDVKLGCLLDFNLDNPAASAPLTGTRANELSTPQELADIYEAPFASADADILAGHTFGSMSGTDESSDGGSNYDTPLSVRTGHNTVSAGSSAGNNLAGNSNNTLPAPTASNKRRRDAQDEAEDQRPAQRRATTPAASLTVGAPLPPLALGPVPTIVRGTCQRPAPPQRHWNADAEKANRQGKSPGWAQAHKHHRNKCNPFVAGGCQEGCALRACYPATSRKWEEQRFLIEWRDDGKQQEVVNGFFVDAESCSQRPFMVRGKLDASGAIHKKSKKVSCWYVYEPSP